MQLALFSEGSMEEWKKIKGFEGYEISSNGKVRSLDKVVHTVYGAYRTIKGKILKPRLDSKKSYQLVDLTNKQGERKTFLLHRLVCATFVGDIPNNMEVNHKNGNKLDNNASNLEIVTRSQNEKHKYEVLGYKGPSFHKYGIAHHRSRRVAQIDSNGNIIQVYGSVREAERETGICNSCITLCCNGKQGKAGGYKWEYRQL